MRISLDRARRLWLASLILCLLVTSLSGCAGLAPTPEPTECLFVHHTGETEHYQALADVFQEQNPHITIRLQASGAENADAFVDLPFDMATWLADNRIMSLDPFMEGDASFQRDDLYPGTLEVFSDGGKTWAIPAGLDPVMMYYNQNLFDQHDLAYPEAGWTWDDFLNAAVAIRDPDAGVFGYAAPGEFETIDVVNFMYQHGGRIVDDLSNPTTVTFDDPMNVEALDWYARLVNEYNVIPTEEQAREAFELGGGNVYAGVIGGKVGMWMGWFSQRGNDPSLERLRAGMVPLPRDAQPATLATGEGYFISSKAKDPEACWQWISFLSKQVPKSLVPARRSVAESAQYKQFAGEEAAAAARAAIANATVVTPEIARLIPVLGILARAVEDAINGRRTPADALNAAQQQAGSLLGQ